MSQIRKVAVCGAGGTMGAGIAMVAARAGFETLCFDQSAEALGRSRAAAESFFGSSVARGRMSEAERDAALARLRLSTDLADLADCDLVIEAIFENLAAKQALFTQLNAICKPQTLFASNTSTLSITQIASGCGREDRVVGMHFCLPAQMMKLIEMSRGMNTSAASFEAAWAWTEAAGQLPVETQDRPGFILNALLVPFNNDVLRAIEAGLASAEDIDTAIRAGLGYKMGPCTLIDLIGLDTQERLGEAFYPITLDPRAAVPPIVRRMVAAGWLGKKVGKGLLGGAPRVKATEAPAYSLTGQSASFPAGGNLAAGSAGERLAVDAAGVSFAADAAVESLAADAAGVNLAADAVGESFVARASASGEVAVQLGGAYLPAPEKLAVLVELGRECLGCHTGEDSGREGSNVLGFARYRNGADAPSNLIELVRQPATRPEAIEAARAVFEAAGFETAVCLDRPGRIVDRLVRPKYNDALRFLDEGLASAEDMDKTCRLGLGYPDGPIERVVRGSLAEHHAISLALYQATGQSGYLPARAAQVAVQRAAAQQGAASQV